MALKISLIRLPALIPTDGLSFRDACPSLGLAYIAAIVRDHGYDIQVIDAIGEGIEDYSSFDDDYKLMLHGLDVRSICDRVDADADVIGITSMFVHEMYLLEQVAASIKQKFPEKTIVAGGENVTSNWERVLNDIPAIDYCVRGEGEHKFIDLLHTLENGLDPLEVDGVAGRREGVAVKNVLGKRFLDIDKIPWPAWDLFPLKAYHEHEFNSGVNLGRSIPMLTSRGCPYSCKFCSAPEMWTTRYVAREPVDVVNEIEYYVNEYQIENVDFNDLTSLLNKKWIVQFCEEILKREISITWQLPQGSRSEVITEETARLLYMSGCRNYTFAPESGSERLIKLMKKNLKLDSLLTATKTARKNGIVVGVNFILGTPDETYSDIWKTYKFLIKCALAGLDECAVMIFGPYPGSDYYNRLMEDGMIDYDKNYIYSSLLRGSTNVRSYNKNFKTWHLLLLQYICLFTFWGLSYSLRPRKFFRIITNVMRRKEERSIDKLVNRKLKQLKIWDRVSKDVDNIPA